MQVASVLHAGDVQLNGYMLRTCSKVPTGCAKAGTRGARGAPEGYDTGDALLFSCEDMFRPEVEELQAAEVLGKHQA